MGYDRETATKPLTGDEFDVIILQEREQRLLHHLAFPDYLMIPSKEYCELRDMYEKLIDENERLRAERDAAIQDLYDMACGMREQPSDTACCFACKWNDIDECAGFESNSCFVWRGLEGNDG